MYRWLGGATLYWGLFAGILGMTLLLNWAFSGHPDGWHNANLLLFWPTDLMLIPLGWRLLTLGQAAKDRWPLPSAGRLYAFAHFAAFAAWILFAAMGVIQQDIWQVALWFGLAALGLFGAITAVGFIPYEAVVKTRVAKPSLKGRKLRPARR
jgi:hypothetical protein